MNDTKATRLEVVEKVRMILAECSDPAEELIATGEALGKIGRVLKGLSVEEARSVLRAVIVLEPPR